MVVVECDVNGEIYRQIMSFARWEKRICRFEIRRVQGQPSCSEWLLLECKSGTGGPTEGIKTEVGDCRKADEMNIERKR